MDQEVDAVGQCDGSCYITAAKNTMFLCPREEEGERERQGKMTWRRLVSYITKYINITYSICEYNVNNIYILPPKMKYK